MKKFIFFSVMTACMISFAGNDPKAADALRAAHELQNQRLQQEVAKATIITFKNAPSQKLIKIVESEQTREMVRRAMETIEASKKSPRVQNQGPGINETIGGGWQPEVSEMAKTVGGFINEISRNLGEGCTALAIDQYVSVIPMAASKDVEIDISLLSEGAQICLRK